MSSKKNYDTLPGGNHLTRKPVRNIAASVRQRLLNKSKADTRPYQELVQYYAMERFLYRLAQSQHANLGTMRLNLQIDIGFGDIIYPGPEK